MSDKSSPLLIVGSCVSRDILEVDAAGCTLEGYIARTSMASVGVSAVADSDVRSMAEALQSQFQRDMILNDLDKTTLERVQQAKARHVLVDFVDERFTLICSGNSFFSLSGELQKAGVSAEGRAVIEPGIEPYFTLWLNGFERFVLAVGTDRIILNRAFWARGTRENPTAFSESWVTRNNQLLGALYERIESRWQFKTIRYPDDLVVGNAAHRWGEAPYHFEDALYRHAAAQIRSYANEMGE
ncbi:DUF6270 domain-containing protein [Lysobacter olei]